MFDRLAGSLREQGYSAQEVEAVLALRPQRLGDVSKRLTAVRAFAALPEAPALAAANTANIVFTSGLGIYTRNGATLSPVTGYTGSTTYTWASNTANYSSLIGGRLASFPFTTTLTGGEYYFVLKLSTTNNSSIGTATTAIANTISMILGSTYTAVNFAEFGAVTSASTTGAVMFQGLCSVDYTATSQTYQQSQVSMSGVPGVRANFPVRLWST